MSNDKTVIGVKYFDDTTVNEMSESPSVMLHQEKPGVPYYPDEARSLAAALVRHADAIDPPDKNDTATLMTEAFHAERAYGRELVAHLRHVAENTNHYPVPGVSHITEPTTGGPLGCGPCYVWRVLNGSPDAADVPVGSLDPLAENLRTEFHTGGVIDETEDLAEQVTEDDEPEVAGWQVETKDGRATHTSYLEVDYPSSWDGAVHHADMIGGTVRELRYGPVIHDASGPKQCEWKPSAYPDEATGCWRNVHRAGRHVWETSVGHLVFSSASDSIAEAIVAAVRDRDEREGR